jgi:phage baseplate assembly protein W
MTDDSNQGNEFLGSGIAFPISLDSGGRVVMNSLDEHVRQSILLILRTAKGERVMRPDFGAGLQEVVFSPIDASTAALVQHEVKDALVKFEPRIDVLNVDVSADRQQEGVLLINVEYRVRRTDTTFNLVYPFYIERGEV